jgi:NNP family nitrate/nitrite transporter-like MFS transporter
MTNKVEQSLLATLGFFWAFLMWFSTAAFSPSIGATFDLTTGELALLASSAIWLAPPGRVLAGGRPTDWARTTPSRSSSA